MSESYSFAMAEAMNKLGEHTFRIGKVLATVSGFSSEKNCFTVNNISASYDGVPITLDVPLNWVNFNSNDDPTDSAHELIADTVRTMAE
jgi:hypothetical protein